MDSASASTIGFAIIVAGYFIGKGIRNGMACSNKEYVPKEERGLLDLMPMQYDDIVKRKFVKKQYIAKWLGIPKKKVETFTAKYPNIPSITIDGEVYYIREELNEWFIDVLNNK
jgi:hypothetical protein